MIETNKYKNLQEWINHLLALGKYSFTLSQLRTAFMGQSETAIKSSLKRLVDKGQIISIHKGYYLIIIPQYMSKGMLPPVLFLDQFMNNLGRSYYLALLNAASYHGASHQQPQEFFVVTGFPVLRPTKKKGLRINYISKKSISQDLLISLKTEAGYLKVSNPLLTATDLIQYEKRVGGLNRVAAILAELTESIKTTDLNISFMQQVPVATLQRFGYLLDKVIENQILSTALFEVLSQNNIPLYRIPLKASAPTKGFQLDERWKVLVNSSIEFE